MTILGVDPGTGRLGWGIIEKEGRRLIPVAYGLIETSKDKDRSARLLSIHNELTRVVRGYQLDLVAVEELFFSKNITTAMSVAEARGIVLLVAAESKIPVAAYSPMSVKSALGFGGAKKEQIGQMVKILLKIKDKFKTDDVADALAVAICAAQQVKQKS